MPISSMIFRMDTIHQIKESFPFTVAEELSDPEWVRAKQEECALQLRATQEQVENLEMIIAGLMGESADG